MKKKANNAANLGFEAQPWADADALRKVGYFLAIPSHNMKDWGHCGTMDPMPRS
ncbi:MAG: hypothetical protein QME77_03035 [bacterium]|nr:hypothetical protein [bacterium]